jgi:hypothetical protein
MVSSYSATSDQEGWEAQRRFHGKQLMILACCIRPQERIANSKVQQENFYRAGSRRAVMPLPYGESEWRNNGECDF